MSTIINTPGNRDGDSSATGVVLTVVIIAIALIALYLFSTGRFSGTANTPTKSDATQINVSVPTPTSNPTPAANPTPSATPAPTPAQ